MIAGASHEFVFPSEPDEVTIEQNDLEKIITNGDVIPERTVSIYLLKGISVLKHFLFFVI